MILFVDNDEISQINNIFVDIYFIYLSYAIQILKHYIYAS